MIDNYIKTKKSLGQNFLIDSQIANDFVNYLDVDLDDKLIEIGAGIGSISTIVFKNNKYKSYNIYEIDNRFKPILEEYSNSNTRIINEDILQSDLSYITNEHKVFGALPYYITSPIIHKLLYLQNPPNILLLIVQKEVAEKIVQKTPKANYWTYITYFYEKEILQTINEDSFDPSPKVKSSIIKFVFNENKFEIINKIGIKKWEGFLHLVYKNPRKMINKTFDKIMLQKLDIDASLRPQNLNFEQLVKIYNYKYNEQ